MRCPRWLLALIAIGACVNAFAQSVTVSGKVISQEGDTPLPGVNVTVKGSTLGAVTDANGEYNINAPVNSTLVYSFIGYVSEEINIGTRTNIDVALVADVKALSEVVVIGYGERERKDLTGAISSVNANEIVKTAIASPEQALQGRVAGVQVSTTSGDPGAKQTIRIRGVGTLGNNDPLIVIDGIPIAENQVSNLQDVPNPLALINPADIESIDVLKDASAAAIYGVRASNGVIIITTKRGKQGKARVSLDMYRGVQQIRKFYDVLGTMPTRRWYGKRTQTGAAAGTAAIAPTPRAKRANNTPSTMCMTLTFKATCSGLMKTGSGPSTTGMH